MTQHPRAALFWATYQVCPTGHHESGICYSIFAAKLLASLTIIQVICKCGGVWSLTCRFANRDFGHVHSVHGYVSMKLQERVQGFNKTP